MSGGHHRDAAVRERHAALVLHGGALDVVGAGEEPKGVEHGADLREVPSDLDDRGRVGGLDPGAELGLVEGGGHHREDIVARRERGARRRGARGERRDAGDDPHGVPLDHAREEEAERPVEEGVPLAETRHVAPRVEMPADRPGGLVVDLLRRKAGRHHRHPDRDLDLARPFEMGGDDGPGEALAGLRSRVGKHRGGLERPKPLHGDEVGIAGADADADEGAGRAHRLRTASSVTG